METDGRYSLTTRRRLGLGAIAMLPANAAFAVESRRSRPSSYTAYVGARTTKARSAHGDGINVFRVNSATGAWTHLQVQADGDNPSFLAFDSRRRFLFAVHGDGVEVSSHRIDAQGCLTSIGRQATGGSNPVHLALDPTDRWLVIAHHGSPTVSVLPVRGDGGLGSPSQVLEVPGGPGPRPRDQPHSRTHEVVFDPSGAVIALPDKGLDRIHTFRLDATRGTLLRCTGSPMVAIPGTEPRHVSFHPTRPYAYLLSEVASTLTAMQFDLRSGMLTPFQIISSLPDTCVAPSWAGEIAIAADGRFVYASNRGHDSIGAFAVSPTTGRLKPIGWRSTRGRTPRHFALSPDGALLLAANEDSDAIVTYRVDPATGELTPVGLPISVGSPVCILLREAPVTPDT